MRRSPRTLLPALVAAATLAAGCGGSDGSVGAAAAPADGRSVYEDGDCSSCHRIDGRGNTGPGNDLTHVGSRLSRQRIRAVLGDPPAGMPSYEGRLSSEQMDAVARYLARLK